MTIAIIGGGAFGTALAAVCANAGREVRLWTRDAKAATAINQGHENSARLPGVELSTNIHAISDMGQVGTPDVVLLVLPAQVTHGWIDVNHTALPDCPVVCCSKGIDRETGLFQSQLVARHVPTHRIAALSGPGFASEIARGLPTAMAIASYDVALAENLQSQLSTPTLRLYAAADVLGVELGGALKNIIAIGCGVVAGAGLGQSARAALLTRGFAEMVKLAMAMGARAETMSGLAGLGDLTLTATSETSRNYAMGLAMGAGTPPDDGKTTEGAYTARVALDLAHRHKLDLPVIETISRLIEGELTVREAVDYVFSRPLGKEF